MTLLCYSLLESVEKSVNVVITISPPRQRHPPVKARHLRLPQERSVDALGRAGVPVSKGSGGMDPPASRFIRAQRLLTRKLTASV